MGPARLPLRAACALVVLAVLAAVPATLPVASADDGKSPRGAGKSVARLERADGNNASDRPGGTAVRYHIRSTVLNETRRVLVATPPSFAQTARRYPVILAFDGEYLCPDVLT